MNIHILGVCGTFMGGIAVLAKQAGHQVTGCDSNVYPPMSTQLEAQGIGLIEGFAADQLALKPDVYVIGNVVARGNPLMEAILDQGVPYCSGPQWLAENLLRDKWVLAVSGTHGKTTTSSMLAWLLETQGMNPGYLIGGIPENFGVSARLTDSSFFVIEADEYDTAFFDKRSKFVHYHPRTLILNNLEFDHADIFADLAAIETQFHHLLRTVPRQGRVVANGAEPALERVLAKGCWTPVEYFAVPGGWHLTESDANGFSVFEGAQLHGRVQWDLLGMHNAHNALAALAAARHVGVQPAAGIEALGQFRNVKRRMEVKGQVHGITVYDDFAHHPTAIATTLAGLRSKVGAARIIAVLEPRSNTMKMGTLKDALPDSLDVADVVFCYAHQLGWDAQSVLAPLGKRLAVIEDFETLVAAVSALAQTGDHVLVMSNGGFNGFHQRLLLELHSSGISGPTTQE